MAAGGDDSSVTRFWGTTLTAGSPLKLSLTLSELHVTQAVLMTGKRATLYASTSGVSSIAVAVLTAASPTALVDVCFFDDDETVELRVDGEGASIALSGSICVSAPNEEGDDDGDEDAPKATFVEQNDDADEDEVRIAPRHPRIVSLLITPLLFPHSQEDELDETEIDAMYADDDEDDENDDVVDDDDEGEGDEDDDDDARAPPAKPAASAPAGKRARDDERVPAEAKSAKKTKDAADAPAAGMSPAAGGNFVPIAATGGKVMMKDIRVGGGAVARPGQKVTVAYVGQLKNGSVFDRSKSFSFKLGKGEVIRGWDVGVAGMRVGGSRDLIIHAEFGYGSRGAPPSIPPGATLKFTVDLQRA
jgi:FK506-binding nuclear protein